MKYEHDLGLRFIAYLIDSIVVGIFSEIFSGVTNIGGMVWSELSLRSWTNFWDEFLWFAIYFVIFAVANKGITIGKMATNLQVYTSDMKDVSQSNLIVRELIKAALLPIIVINFIIVAVREDNKSIHDMLTDTIVLKPVGNSVEYKEPPKKEYRNPADRDDYYD